MMIAAYTIPDELLARCAGKETICKKVLIKFVEQMRQDLPQLRHLLSTGDAIAGSRLAHRIKGASANVVANQLSSIGSRIESLAGTEQIAEATSLLDELESAWTDFEELTSNFLST